MTPSIGRRAWTVSDQSGSDSNSSSGGGGVVPWCPRPAPGGPPASPIAGTSGTHLPVKAARSRPARRNRLSGRPVRRHVFITNPSRHAVGLPADGADGPLPPPSAGRWADSLCSRAAREKLDPGSGGARWRSPENRRGVRGRPAATDPPDSAASARRGRTVPGSASVRLNLASDQLNSGPGAVRGPRGAARRREHPDSSGSGGPAQPRPRVAPEVNIAGRRVSQTGRQE